MSSPAKQDWTRNPNDYVFDHVTPLPVSVGTIAGTTANTAVAAYIPLSVAVKVVRATIGFLTAGALDSTHKVNVVYNTLATPNSGGTVGAVAANDNSFTGPPPGGLGFPTNGAVDGNALFSADITLNTTNFPGASTSNGGIADFTPTNYDAVYPAGGLLTPAGLSAYFTIRAVTPGGGGGSITGLSVTLLVIPITLTESWAKPGAPISVCLPGVSF